MSSTQKLSVSVQSLLINILAASETIPYLKNETLHIVTDFILSQMPKSEDHQAMFAKRRVIDLDMNEILPVLLRTRICKIFHEGYWHKLSAIGNYLVGNAENKVNLECAIKRIFY